MNNTEPVEKAIIAEMCLEECDDFPFIYLHLKIVGVYITIHLLFRDILH